MGFGKGKGKGKVVVERVIGGCLEELRGGTKGWEVTKLVLISGRENAFS